MAAVPLSCLDCYSELFCGEDAGSLSDDFPELSPEVERPPYLDFAADADDSMAYLVEGESSYSPALGYLARFRSRPLDAADREESVAWILKVHAFYGFQPLTAYLAINYMDRFLSSHRFPEEYGWAWQLLSVACLSLAAKMEETQVPLLIDFQVEGSRFIFEPRAIMRMELLILSALKWRLRSVTPFSFVGFFACKVDPSGSFIRFLISRATETILATLQVIDFLDYWPSSVAAAAILLAADGIPNLALADPEDAGSWCAGLSNERIAGCYQLMQGISQGLQRKPPKDLQQLRVTTPVSLGAGSASSSSSSAPTKRRKLNNCLRMHDGWEDQSEQ